MCKKLIYLISLLVLALFLMSSAQAANITLVTETQDYDADGIQDDQQLIDWLVAEGHTVDVRPDYWTSFGRTTVAELNASDLIILSRSTGSGNYVDEDEPTKWNSLTSPLILMNAYVVRNIRWLWLDSESMLGEGGAPALEAVDPGHPIFTNVPLDASNQVQVLDGAVGSGHTSFIDAADVGNGTLIAQTVDGLPWIVEWDAGVEFYAGAGQVPGGKRMMFSAGTQEIQGTLTPYGAWNFTADGEILFRNAISYMLGEPIVPIVPPPPALVGHWKFDDGEGTVAVDSSGNGNDGIINGDPQWVDGIIGGALEFNGDDYVNCGNGPSLQIQDAITMAFWFKVEAFQNTWEGFMAKGDDSYRVSRGGGTGDATHMGISGTSVGGGNGWFNGTVIVTDNQWHHMAATYDGAEGRIYIDGVLDVTSPGTGQINISDYDLYIGENSQATGRFFHGLLDDVRIYDGAMTEEGVQAIMMPTPEPVDPGTEGLVAYFPLENDVLDASGNGNDGIVDGDPTFVEGVVGMAMEFDGDDHVDTGNTDDLAVWTIACWAKSPVAPSGDAPSGPVHREKNYQFNWNHSDDTFRGSVTVSAGGWHAAKYGEVEADTWYHLAGTYDGEDLKAYKDGVLITTNDAPSGLPVAETGTLKLGRHATAVQYFTGTVDEAIVYSRVLSDPEIRYLAGERATPVDPGSSGLLAWWTCDEGEGTVVGDSSGNGYDGVFVNGDPAWVEGIHGSAVELVGPTLIEAPPLNVELTEATMAGWIKPNGPQPDWSSFIMQRDPGLATGFNILGYQLAYHWNDTSDSWSFRGGDMIAEDGWTFAAVTIEPDKATFYVNGEAGSVNEISHGPCMWDSNVYLGGDGTEGWVSRRMNGALDDVLIYDRALSPGEVRYLAGHRPMVDPGTDNLIAYYPLDIDTLDASGNGNDGTVNGDPTFVDGMVATAMEFDGDGDFLDCGNNPILTLTDAVSISAWIKVAVQGADHKVGGNQDGANGGYKMGVVNDKIEFEIRTSGNSAVLNRDVAGGTVLEVGVWYQVVGVYSLADGYIRTYVNGELDRELETTEALGASPGSLMIGCEPYSTSDCNFNGVMDDIRVYNKALSEDEARYLGNN